MASQSPKPSSKRSINSRSVHRSVPFPDSNSHHRIHWINLVMSSLAMRWLHLAASNTTSTLPQASPSESHKAIPERRKNTRRKLLEQLRISIEYLKVVVESARVLVAFVFLLVILGLTWKGGYRIRWIMAASMAMYDEKVGPYRYISIHLKDILYPQLTLLQKARKLFRSTDINLPTF